MVKGKRQNRTRELQEQLKRRLEGLPSFAVDFIYTERSKQLSTRIEYTKDIHLFFDYLIEEMNIRDDKTDIIPQDLENLRRRNITDYLDYLTSYTKTYLSRKGKVVTQVFENDEVGKARKLATLHRLYGYLVEEELISRNPAERVKADPKKKASVREILTPEEIEAFFLAVTSGIYKENGRMYKFHQKTKLRDHTMLMILAYSGIRISELVALNVDDIRLKREEMIILRKGGDEEIFPLSDVLIDCIGEYMEEREKVDPKTLHDPEALFLSLHRRRIHPRSVRNMIKKYQQLSGVETPITPHTFRRTFGTNHYNLYGDMYLTAEVLGHRSANTTRDYYVQPSHERVKHSVKTFRFGELKEEQEMNDKQEAVRKLASELGISSDDLLDKVNSLL